MTLLRPADVVLRFAVVILAPLVVWWERKWR